ncbi:hypothetical protein T02_13161 [Trichinella nativa]|uniref:Uncharacterized protein n=1 Tax=Trichinella nativa TaxID=6335 RepID=A0A0V1KT77_9BILA|nr:hypothetical protein T06_3024 [Trichinella sp. T6]KRZ50528.1 hypothetical protein T02_13161 [Trichinella nativa]
MFRVSRLHSLQRPCGPDDEYGLHHRTGCQPIVTLSLMPLLGMKFVLIAGSQQDLVDKTPGDCVIFLQ